MSVHCFRSFSQAAAATAAVSFRILVLFLLVLPILVLNGGGCLVCTSRTGGDWLSIIGCWIYGGCGDGWVQKSKSFSKNEHSAPGHAVCWFHTYFFYTHPYCFFSGHHTAIQQKQTQSVRHCEESNKTNNLGHIKFGISDSWDLNITVLFFSKDVTE